MYIPDGLSIPENDETVLLRQYVEMATFFFLHGEVLDPETFLEFNHSTKFYVTDKPY